MISRIERRRFIAHAALGTTSLVLLRSVAACATPSFKTVSPGVLTVAINGDMPMTSVKDGKLIGTDGEMIIAIAERPRLEAKPSLMEWSATCWAGLCASATHVAPRTFRTVNPLLNLELSCGPCQPLRRS